MKFAVAYFIGSALLFIWVMTSPRFKRLPKKLVNNHPEMAEVRQTDSLFVASFDQTESDATPPPEEIV